MAIEDVETGGGVYEELQRKSFARSSKATAESLEEGRRMGGAAIARFLANRRYAAVATTRRDGRAHAAMTGYFADGATVWLPVMPGTARASNVRSHPYASVIVADGEGDEHTMVTVEGPATVVESLPDETLARWQARFGSLPDWADAWIRVDVDRLFSFAAVASAYAATAGP